MRRPARRVRISGRYGTGSGTHIHGVALEVVRRVLVGAAVDDTGRDGVARIPAESGTNGCIFWANPGPRTRVRHIAR